MKRVLAIFIGAVILIGMVYYLNNLSRPEIAKAGASDNVSGWAWSENIGWISFNSTNTGAAVDYGVNIDPSTGLFSGEAWSGGTDSSASGTIGWIDFAPSGPYPGSPNYSVCLDLPGSGQTCDGVGNYKVSGWARALSATSSPGGWDGWIKLNGTTTDGTPYGVSLNPVTREFEGWAAGWDDSTSTAVIGWISFNCKDGGSNGENICATSPYKVATSLVLGPTASNPTSTFTYCAWGYTPQAAPGLAITLRWDYSGPKPQSSYEILLDNDSDFSGTKFNHTASVSSHNYALNLSQDDNHDWRSQLAPNTTYYWKVKVTDTAGNSSWSNVAHFTTPDQYPNPDFTPSPPNGTVGQVLTFGDNSTCSGSCSYSWDFGDGSPIDNTNGTTTHAYTKTGTYKPTLNIADDVGICTSSSKTIHIGAILPWWREIVPFQPLALADDFGYNKNVTWL